MAGLFETPDDRTDEEYEQEVDMYCQKYKAALLRRYRWRLRKHLGTRLCIEAVNPTEDNFTGIELEIHVPGRVQKWPDDAGTNDVDSSTSFHHAPDTSTMPGILIGRTVGGTPMFHRYGATFSRRYWPEGFRAVSRDDDVRQ